MTNKLVDPVLEATRNVFVTMARLEPRVGTAEIKTDVRARGDVTGLIGIEGIGIKGSMAITFPEAVILDLTQRMLQMEVDTIDDMVRDLAGELSNMVLGGAKCLLETQGYDLGLTLPKVLYGKDHTVDHLLHSPTLLLPLTTPSGTFYIEICFSEFHDA